MEDAFAIMRKEPQSEAYPHRPYINTNTIQSGWVLKEANGYRLKNTVMDSRLAGGDKDKWIVDQVYFLLKRPT